MLRKKIPTVEVVTLLCLQEVITVKIALKRLQEAHSASVFFATRSRAGPAVPTISTDGNALPVAAWNHKVGERFGLALNSGLRNLRFLLICSLSRVMEGGT